MNTVSANEEILVSVKEEEQEEDGKKCAPNRRCSNAMSGGVSLFRCKYACAQSVATFLLSSDVHCVL